MFKAFSTLLGTLLLSQALWSQSAQSLKLPVAESDWLIKSPDIRAEIYLNDQEVILANGLVSRTIRITPNAATVGLMNLVTGEEYIRSIKPEAMVKIEGTSYPVGGLAGQKEHGYLKLEWLEEMSSPENAFQF